jgi:hypothetical protein
VQLYVHARAGHARPLKKGAAVRVTRYFCRVKVKTLMPAATPKPKPRRSQRLRKPTKVMAKEEVKEEEVEEEVEVEEVEEEEVEEEEVEEEEVEVEVDVEEEAEEEAEACPRVVVGVDDVVEDNADFCILRVLHKVVYYAAHVGVLALATACLVLVGTLVHRLACPAEPSPVAFVTKLMRTLLVLGQLGVYSGVAFAVIDGGFTINTVLGQWGAIARGVTLS